MAFSGLVEPDHLDASRFVKIGKKTLVVRGELLRRGVRQVLLAPMFV